MAKDLPIFDLKAVAWANMILFQALILQLMESRALSVGEAEKVFERALEGAKIGRRQMPDAEGIIRYLRDELDWDKYRRWAASQKDPTGDRSLN